MKPLVIYHDNCTDGFGAAFVAWLKLGYDADYCPMQYGEVPTIDAFPEINDREIYIVDFSLPKLTMEFVIMRARRVIWLDHHKTAFEMWCEREREFFKEDNEHVSITLDNNKSGAMLTWEYFFPTQKPPMLIRHIDDYDRWQFSLEGTKEIIRALWTRTPWDFNDWKRLLPGKYGGYMNALSNLKKEGAAILKAHNANVEAVVKSAARKCSIVMLDEVRHGYAANCPPHLQSDVGHALANKSNTFGLLWHINKDNKCLCSLRSVRDYDVSVIAKAFGGGGHKNAAGFEVDIQTLLSWIA